MADQYDAKTSEPKIIEFWQKEGIFKFNPESNKPIYSVDTPPPTVSGEMHIGHAFSYTQSDIIVRYKRLRGFNIFYPFGTDDNGLPTERLVEKLKGVKGSRMDRQEFIKLCEETLKELRPKFLEDWKRIGSSCDFSLFYSTINQHCQKIGQKSFLDLKEMNRAYRKEAPVLWCPSCETAVSQVECNDKMIKSTFNDIIFKVENKDIIIATTRPEMLGACVAIFVHPDDDRYKNLIGKQAKVPLYDLKVNIMADKRVEKDKGTGIVMCCTFGDQTDIEWFKAYNLELKQVIGRNGKLTALAGKYKDLKVAEARKQILEDLKKEGLLIAQKPIEHAVKTHERCSNEIEIINSKQWFIKYLDLKENLLKWGNDLQWFPDFMKHRYNNWVQGLQWDWLISRQRFFGIPFPVWYCKKCDEPIFAEEHQLPIDPTKTSPTKKCKCGSTDFTPEKDVLDTWATSSLTPDLAISLVEEKYRKKLFPMSLRPQAHDIISFWLFNTLVKSQLHHNQNPWKDVAISGFVTLSGQKMSKSKGNVVRPQDVLQTYGADALRYWASGSKLGEDMDYQEKDLKTGQKFVNKLWNAAKFTGMHIKEGTPTTTIDIWILTKLAKTIREATEAMDNYEYSKAKFILEHFFWNFCDNYLELIKMRLYNENESKEKESAGATLSIVFNALLRLWAPITPFITEELYQNMFKKEQTSIHNTEWPKAPAYADKEKESAGDIISEVLSAVRKKKSENKLSMKAPIKELVIETEICLPQDALKDLQNTVCAEKISSLGGTEKLSENVKITVKM